MNKVATALGASGVARTDKTLAGAARTTIATRRRAVYCEPQDPRGEIVSLRGNLCQGAPMSRNPLRGVVVVTTIALALPPLQAFAQPKPTPVAEAAAREFNVEQLDAMLAPIALYPDELLTQTLMASTYPLQVVAAARWLEKDNNKSLKGDALVKALEKENWDPSVKSLIPFPQVIGMMNENLEWTQQLGYAVATQQAAALDSIQRLRRQAQIAGTLKTTEQQRVVINKEIVVIDPAQPETVYVPVYQPANVYGEWPYPANPPVYIPPPAAYYPPAYATAT
jgi:hypothetical protein